jgi:nucleoside-specific outer membrane channel protein Tsx
MCKLAHPAVKHSNGPSREFYLVGTYRKLTPSRNANRQSIHIFGEGLAICCLLGRA